MFLFVAFLIFTVALGAAGYYVWSVPRQMEQDLLSSRLRELRAAGGVRSRVVGDLIKHERPGAFAVLSRVAGWIGGLRRLQESIDQANLKYRAPNVCALVAVIAAVIWFVLGAFGTLPLLRLGLALLAGSIPLIYVMSMRTLRLRKFEAGLPDAIDVFNRSMKAGHNMHAGLETVAQETFDPVRMEFRKVIEELALGSPTEEALHNLGRRVPVIALKFLITGLILQRQTGADLVQVLENLSQLIRERLNLEAKMRAATAQQRFSAGLLCSLPAVVGFAFWIIKPEYIRLLFTDPTGQRLLMYAMISEALGLLIIRKIANPRF